MRRLEVFAQRQHSLIYLHRLTDHVKHYPCGASNKYTPHGLSNSGIELKRHRPSCAAIADA